MLIRIKQGFDMSPSGEPGGEVSVPTTSQRVALIGGDFRDTRLAVKVGEGDRVRAGEIICMDRRQPEIGIAAPGSGVVSEIRQGPGRILESLVIELNDDPPLQFEPIASDTFKDLSAASIRKRLLDSGLWPGFRARPYERMPAADNDPRAIFVTAIDTRPLAPDPMRVIVENNTKDFRNGLAILSRLTAGPVYLCTANQEIPEVPDCDNLRHVRFSGPHPAGLPGTHIHALETVRETPDLWHIGYQDVVAIGQQFTSGILPQHRVIAAAGPGMQTPAMLRVRIGAELKTLVPENTIRSGAQIVSGSVLDGHVAPGFLGRFHNQVTVLPPANAAASHAGGRLKRAWRMLRRGTTARDSGLQRLRDVRPSGMLPLAAFENLWPYQAPVSALLRALLTGDVETALGLGCRGLAEEDLSLLTQACVAGIDYGQAQREILRTIEREGL